MQILHFELQFGEKFDTDINVATKTYISDIQDVFLTKKMPLTYLCVVHQRPLELVSLLPKGRKKLRERGFTSESD